MEIKTYKSAWNDALDRAIEIIKDNENNSTKLLIENIKKEMRE